MLDLNSFVHLFSLKAGMTTFRKSQSRPRDTLDLLDLPEHVVMYLVGYFLDWKSIKTFMSACITARQLVLNDTGLALHFATEMNRYDVELFTRNLLDRDLVVQAVLMHQKTDEDKRLHVNIMLFSDPRLPDALESDLVIENLDPESWLLDVDPDVLRACGTDFFTEDDTRNGLFDNMVIDRLAYKAVNFENRGMFERLVKRFNDPNRDFLYFEEWSLSNFVVKSNCTWAAKILRREDLFYLYSETIIENRDMTLAVCEVFPASDAPWIRNRQPLRYLWGMVDEMIDIWEHAGMPKSFSIDDLLSRHGLHVVDDSVPISNIYGVAARFNQRDVVHRLVSLDMTLPFVFYSKLDRDIFSLDNPDECHPVLFLRYAPPDTDKKVLKKIYQELDIPEKLLHRIWHENIEETIAKRAANIGPSVFGRVLCQMLSKGSYKRVDIVSLIDQHSDLVYEFMQKSALANMFMRTLEVVCMPLSIRVRNNIIDAITRSFKGREPLPIPKSVQRKKDVFNLLLEKGWSMSPEAWKRFYVCM